MCLIGYRQLLRFSLAVASLASLILLVLYYQWYSTATHAAAPTAGI
jgi:uncharacterized membrane protein